MICYQHDVSRPEDSYVSPQEVEGDWRDTTSLGFAPCHCEQKEHLRDAGDTQYQENARTQQVEDRNRIVRESLADNCKTSRTQGI